MNIVALCTLFYSLTKMWMSLAVEPNPSMGRVISPSVRNNIAILHPELDSSSTDLDNSSKAVLNPA